MLGVGHLSPCAFPPTSSCLGTPFTSQPALTELPLCSFCLFSLEVQALWTPPYPKPWPFPPEASSWALSLHSIHPGPLPPTSVQTGSPTQKALPCPAFSLGPPSYSPPKPQLELAQHYESAAPWS